jgi:hypothetical protein
MWVHGDSNYDRIINAIDLEALAANWGRASLARNDPRITGDDVIDAAEARRLLQLV